MKQLCAFAALFCFVCHEKQPLKELTSSIPAKKKCFYNIIVLSEGGFYYPEI